MHAMGNTAFRRSVVLSLGFFAGMLGASQQARAGEVTISVLGLEPAAGAPETVATAITEAVRQRVTSTSGYRLVQGRDLVEVKLVFSCPDEAPPCMTQAAQSIGAAKIIFGSLQPVGTDAYLVTLKLLDAERGVVEGWSSEQIAKAQSAPVALRAPVQKWFAALTGQATPGNIKVAGGVVGASVWLDGTQVGLLGADGLTLAGVGAGGHEIVVSKTGYEKFERKVTVAAGSTEKITVELKPITRPGDSEEPAAPAPADQAGARISKTEMPQPAEPPNQGARIAAWALLGFGMVGVGLGGYSSYEVSVVNSNLDKYRRYSCATGGPPTCSADHKTPLPDVSDPTSQSYISRQKRSGDSYATAQYIAYGAGGALVAISAVFFYRGYFAKPSATASNKRRNDLIVLPSFGPGNAGALAYLTF